MVLNVLVFAVSVFGLAFLFSGCSTADAQDNDTQTEVVTPTAPSTELPEILNSPIEILNGGKTYVYAKGYARTVRVINHLGTDVISYTIIANYASGDTARFENLATVTDQIENAGVYDITATVMRDGYKPLVLATTVTILKASPIIRLVVTSAGVQNPISVVSTPTDDDNFATAVVDTNAVIKNITITYDDETDDYTATIQPFIGFETISADTEITEIRIINAAVATPTELVEGENVLLVFITLNGGANHSVLVLKLTVEVSVENVTLEYSQIKE